MHQLLLAAPFELDPPTLAFVRSQSCVSGILRWPGQESTATQASDGAFLPDEYNWQLPRPCPRTLLFIDGRTALTARMIASALRRGVWSIVFTEGGDWFVRPVLLLAAGKLWRKAVAACVNAGGPSGSVCQWMLNIGYYRSMRPALSAAPLVFGERWAAEPYRAPAGVVLACPTLVAGGAERQIVTTALGLHAAGLGPVTVLVARLHNPPGNAFFLDHLINAGVTVKEVRAADNRLLRWLDTRRLAATTEGARTLALVQRLPQAVRQEVLELGAELFALNPAVAHCWLDYSNVRAGLAAVCVGVPRVVLSGRNVGPRHFPYIFEPFMRSAYRALLDCPGVVLSNNSRGGAADYAAWLGIDPARIPVIYNGLDLARMQKPDRAEVTWFRQSHGIDAEAPLIGGMFRLSPEKRPLLWLEVAALVCSQRPDVNFLLFGEGPLLQATQRFIDRRALGTRVRLLPPIQDSALALAALDALLLTSEWEGTPNVAIEAQALGTPVVLTGGGGASEALAAAQTGLYVERAEARSMAHAMLGLLADRGQRERMAAAGPDFVEARFGLASMLRHTRRVYANP